LPGVGGRIKTQPEDFDVEEVPAYEPSGQVSSSTCGCRKRGMGAEYFVRQLAKRLDVPTSEIGTAGLKDRHAVTRQWVSVPAACEARLAAVDDDEVRVLRTSRHTNKLKPGHLRGNVFRILIRDAQEAEARLPALIDAVKRNGMPNFYGPQRFGKDGETFSTGMELLAGGGRRLSPLLAQAVALGRPVGPVQRLPGPAAARRPDAARAVRRRHDEVAVRRHVRRRGSAARAGAPRSEGDRPGGPMFGRKMFASKAEAAERESQTLSEAGLTTQAFTASANCSQGRGGTTTSGSMT